MPPRGLLAILVAAHALADEAGVTMHMHQSFGPGDTLAYRSRNGGAEAVEHLENLGVLGPRLQLVHMIYCTESEVAILARTGTSVVHCPAASARVAMGVTRHGAFPQMCDA